MNSSVQQQLIFDAVSQAWGERLTTMNPACSRNIMRCWNVWNKEGTRCVTLLQNEFLPDQMFVELKEHGKITYYKLAYVPILATESDFAILRQP